MKKIVMMYVYYDSLGDIKSIAPVQDMQFENQGYKYATFPFEDVEPFLTSRLNPFNFYVDYKRKNGVDIYKISSKQVIVSYVRHIDNYLSELVEQTEEPNAIYIENNIDEKILTFYIDADLRIKENNGNDAEQDKISSFKRSSKVNFYFTSKNDPSFLIKTITLIPKDLFHNENIKVSYEENLEYASLFTKKFFSYYSYKNKG